MSHVDLVRDINLLINLLDSPDNWIQHRVAAKSVNNYLVDSRPTDLDTICWCLLGACNKISREQYPDNSESPIIRVLAKLIDPDLNTESSTYDWDCCTVIHHWNDEFHRTHKDISQLLNEAKTVIIGSAP